MRRADLIGGIAMLAFSLCMIFVVIPAETQDGGWYGLSPYFFPTFLMAAIAVASLLLVLQSLRGRAAADAPAPPLSWRQVGMFALSAAIVLAGAVTMDFFGIWVGGPALIAGTMLFMGERRPLRIVATAAIPVAVVYLVVLYVLGSPLP